jgi:hypothetical protein
MTGGRVHVGREFDLMMRAAHLAGLRGDKPTHDESAEKLARRVIAEVAVRPDEVETMLARAGIGSVPDPDAVEDIAFECTFRAIEVQEERRWPPSHDLERQASNAAATLRRVLPALIAFAQLCRDPRVVEYSALLAALSPALDFSRLRKGKDWHTAARALAGLY